MIMNLFYNFQFNFTTTQIGKHLESYLERLPADVIMSIKNICTFLTTDLIATTAFHLNATSHQDMNSEFYKYKKGIFDISICPYV